jgi:hypothetical protein
MNKKPAGFTKHATSKKKMTLEVEKLKPIISSMLILFIRTINIMTYAYKGSVQRCLITCRSTYRDTSSNQLIFFSMSRSFSFLGFKKARLISLFLFLSLVFKSIWHPGVNRDRSKLQSYVSNSVL